MKISTDHMNATYFDCGGVLIGVIDECHFINISKGGKITLYKGLPHEEWIASGSRDNFFIDNLWLLEMDRYYNTSWYEVILSKNPIKNIPSTFKMGDKTNLEMYLKKMSRDKKIGDLIDE